MNIDLLKKRKERLEALVLRTRSVKGFDDLVGVKDVSNELDEINAFIKEFEEEERKKAEEQKKAEGQKKADEEKPKDEPQETPKDEPQETPKDEKPTEEKPQAGETPQEGAAPQDAEERNNQNEEAPAIRSAITVNETKGETNMTKPQLTTRDRVNALVEQKRDELQKFSTEFREMLKTRGASMAQAVIPTDLVQVIIDVLKEDSLLKEVDLFDTRGYARFAVFGEMPEAFWTGKGVKLDHEYKIKYAELSDYTLENYIALRNEDVEDLGQHLNIIVNELANSVLRKLRKEIFEGDGENSIVGIKTYLAATQEPKYYNKGTQGEFKAVKDTNVIKAEVLNGGKAGYLQLADKLTAAKKHGDQTFKLAMNEKTFKRLLIELSSTDGGFAAALATNNHTLPMLGDVVITEVLKDNNVVAGYFKNYKLALRRDFKTEFSKDYKFGENLTCYKATMRVDGRPLFGDAFVDVTLEEAKAKPASRQ